MIIEFLDENGNLIQKEVELKEIYFEGKEAFLDIQEKEGDFDGFEN